MTYFTDGIVKNAQNKERCRPTDGYRRRQSVASGVLQSSHYYCYKG